MAAVGAVVRRGGDAGRACSYSISNLEFGISSSLGFQVLSIAIILLNPLFTNLNSLGLRPLDVALPHPDKDSFPQANGYEPPLMLPQHGSSSRHGNGCARYEPQSKYSTTLSLGDIHLSSIDSNVGA